jgi:exopolysaccharide biosynthesis polyprenyl glycosylphosphotransferase
VTTTDLRPIDVFGWRRSAPRRAGIGTSVAFPLAGLSRPSDYPRFSLPAQTVRRTSPVMLAAATVVKRVMDVGISLIAIIVLSPLLVGTALVIRATSAGPVLFRQDRIGLHGKAFRVLKFRSMTVDAEAGVAELMEQNGGYAPFYKIKHDPRVTRVGRFIRRASIDELPQFFNVLRGDMSLVGPRPQVAAEVEQYAFEHNRRLMVKPGITGLWQVSGRSHLDWEATVATDLHYIDGWSLLLDLKILLLTLPAVARGSGAF